MLSCYHAAMQPSCPACNPAHGVLVQVAGVTVQDDLEAALAQHAQQAQQAQQQQAEQAKVALRRREREAEEGADFTLLALPGGRPRALRLLAPMPLMSEPT